jgi:hypothetical protein
MTQYSHEIYRTVHQWVMENPSSIGIITRAIADGAKDYAESTRKERVEWEIIASMVMEKRLFDGNENFLAEKIESMKETNSIKWDHMIEKLREKHATRKANRENQ